MQVLQNQLACFQKTTTAGIPKGNQEALDGGWNMSFPDMPLGCMAVKSYFSGLSPREQGRQPFIPLLYSKAVSQRPRNLFLNQDGLS